MRATIMENGPHTPEEIIASVKRGIYCVFLPMDRSTSVADFAFYVNMAISSKMGATQPIKDANIIGNGPDSLEKMDMIGNDMTIDEGDGPAERTAKECPYHKECQRSASRSQCRRCRMTKVPVSSGVLPIEDLEEKAHHIQNGTGLGANEVSFCVAGVSTEMGQRGSIIEKCQQSMPNCGKLSCS